MTPDVNGSDHLFVISDFSRKLLKARNTYFSFPSSSSGSLSIIFLEAIETMRKSHL